MKLCLSRRRAQVDVGGGSSACFGFGNDSGSHRRHARSRRKIDPRIQSELFVESGLKLREGLPAPKGTRARREGDLRFFFCSADKFVQYLRLNSDRIDRNKDHRRCPPTRVDHCLLRHLSIFLFRNRLRRSRLFATAHVDHVVACELYVQREILLPVSSLGKAYLRWYEIGLTSPSHT